MIALNTVNVCKLTKSGVVFEYNPSEYQLWIAQCHNVDLNKPEAYDCWAVPTPSVVGWDTWSTNMIYAVSISATQITL